MLEDLKEELKKLGKVAICFSGGIDSSFLLFVANKVLPRENVLAIIANGEMVPRKDYDEAIEFLKENEKLMSEIRKEANKNDFENLLDGKNADDLKVYRPGNKAAEELGIISPLAKLNFYKKDIRKYSKELGIKFWDKPSNSCLATRFLYDTTLTKENLKMVESSEEVIKELGIKKVRVREHNEIAKIEVEKENFEIILKHKGFIVEKLKEIGFKYITLDLEGIKSGNFDK